MNKKYILPTAALAFLSFIIYAIIEIGKNTSFLNLAPDDLQIQQNNSTLINQTQEGEALKSVTLPQTSELAQKGIAGKRLNIPEEFEISIFATDLREPRHLDFDSNDNVFVADKGSGEVVLFKGEAKIVIDNGLRNVHSVDYFESDLYVGEEDKVVVYRNIDDNGNFSKKQVLVNDLPISGGHVTRTVRIGPDNKMYVAVGSSCNVCEEDDARRAAIVRYNLDGKDEEIFASGLRNTVDFIFDENGMMWGVDNGRDLIGDDIPPEEVNVIEQGAHYGWPYCYGDRIANPGSNPEYSERENYCQNETKSPVYEMQAHSAPLGMAWSKWQNYEKNLFIAFHGSWNRTVPTGYKVVRIDTANPDAQTIDFVTGWLEDDGNAWGRPVDVKFDSQNRMYITDDKAGVIYLVTQIPSEITF